MKHLNVAAKSNAKTAVAGPRVRLGGKKKKKKKNYLLISEHVVYGGCVNDII